MSIKCDVCRELKEHCDCQDVTIKGKLYRTPGPVARRLASRNKNVAFWREKARVAEDRLAAKILDEKLQGYEVLRTDGCPNGSGVPTSILVKGDDGTVGVFKPTEIYAPNGRSIAPKGGSMSDQEDRKIASILDEVRKVFNSTGFDEFVVDGELYRSDRHLEIDISDSEGGMYRLEIHLKKESEI